MTPNDFRNKMIALTEDPDLKNDIEAFHSRMDQLMCDCLVLLGYGEGVLVFAAQEKWYA